MAAPQPETTTDHFAQMAIFLGAAWCGAVLSQVFLGGEYVRLASVAAMSPALVAWALSWGEGAARRVTWRLGFNVAWLVVLLACVGLALSGKVEFSEGGRLKRVAALVSFGATLWELRRLWRLRGGPLATVALPYPSVLFPSLAEGLAARAAALHVSPRELIARLERAATKAVAARFTADTARFDVKYSPAAQVLGLHQQGQVVFSPALHDLDDEVLEPLGLASEGLSLLEEFDRVTREVCELPTPAPLELAREDWLRHFHSMHYALRKTGVAVACELVVSPSGLPAPVTGKSVFDLVVSGPRVFACESDERVVGAEWLVDGRPVKLGPVKWSALTVSVLGQPGDTTLERWTSKWMQPALDGDGTRLTGAVHRVEVTRYAQSCALEVHLGSAPLTALEELVRELRPFGEVSFDRAALEAVGARSHGGTKEDIVPLVRREGGTLSEHLVGEFWIQYAVESRQAFASLDTREVQSLALGPGQLRDLAVENLRKRIPPVCTTGHEGAYMLTLPGEGGFFEASLLLLDEVWARHAALVKGDVVVGLPCRDLVFVTGTDEVAGLARVRELMADALEKQLEHPLSQQLLVRRDGAWRVLTAKA